MVTGRVLDLSARQPNPPPPTVRMREGKRIVIAKAQIIQGRVVERHVDDIDGITLHQTACYFGAKNDDARHERALKVHAHMTCFRSGVAVLAYPRSWYVYHGHDFCPRTVGQEHEGLFDRDGKVIDAPAGYSLDAVIEAGRAGITSHVETLPALKYLRLHRQTTNKPACPGRIIFREVGLWACQKYGLRFEPELVRRDGTPVPRDWFLD